MLWIFLLIVWTVMSIVGTASYVFETDYDYTERTEHGFGSYKFLPLLYKSVSKKIGMFNLIGKTFVYTVVTLFFLPTIVFNYCIILPLVVVTWGVTNFFFWLFTIKFVKQQKEQGIEYAQVTLPTIEVEIKK